VNPVLPVIDSAARADVRGQDAVVDRGLALLIVTIKGNGLEQSGVVQARARLGIAPSFFTPKEVAFLRDEHPDPTTKAQFAWRSESLYVMQWALGFAPALGRPGKRADSDQVVSLIAKHKGPKRFREDARLRSTKELLDETDLIYRYDWACVDARANGRPAPTGVDCEVVTERHRALNWLIGYLGQDWDKVRTDT
jgi:hypothetical protein